MCTVSFLKKDDCVYLTSNRDEQTIRAKASSPKAYPYKSGNIVFPKDGQAGGTWIAMHENGNAMVLLNGAAEAHLHQPPYAMSRGLVFLKIFDDASPTKAFRDIDLECIEPFTLVIWEQKKLWHALWDGKEKQLLPLNAEVPHIWSSATLYDATVRKKREDWFFEWLGQSNGMPADKDIEHFHEFAGEGNENIDLRMNRNGLLQTVSITSMVLSPSKRSFKYKDLIDDSVHLLSI